MQILHIIALAKLTNSNFYLPKDNMIVTIFSKIFLKTYFLIQFKSIVFLKGKTFSKSSKQIYQNLSQNKSYVSFANNYISNTNLPKPSKHKDKIYPIL